MQHSRLALAAAAMLSLSCASTVAEGPGPEPAPLVEPPNPPAPETPPPSPAKVEDSTARACTMFVKPGVVRRDALVRLIDGGLPRWMQGVQGDRSLANHRFQGWLIKSLYPGDPCYRDIDLQQGDVVQKVNGKSIEKPEQAFDVVQSLKTAPALVVDFLREGKPQHFTLSIADE